MLLLKIDTELYQYWPVVLFTGMLAIVVSLISIFMYIDHKELAEQRAKALITPTTVLAPRRSWWNRFLTRLGIKKKEKVDEVDEYNDMFGRFQFIGAIIILIVIISIISSLDLGSIDLPPSLIFLLHSWWLWFGIGILILMVIFRKKVVEKIKVPNVKWSWWNLWKTLAVILIAIVLWFEVIPWIGDWDMWKGQHSGTQTEQSSEGTTTHRAFFLGKENSMKTGVWYTFTQNDGPLIQFKPATPNTTIVYKIIKLEDETREWKVEVWTDSNGEPSENRLNQHGIEPNKGAKGGDSMIMIDRDAVVISYLE